MLKLRSVCACVCVCFLEFRVLPNDIVDARCKCGCERKSERERKRERMYSIHVGLVLFGEGSSSSVAHVNPWHAGMQVVFLMCICGGRDTADRNTFVFFYLRHRTFLFRKWFF